MVKNRSMILALMVFSIVGACEPAYSAPPAQTAGPTLNIKNQFGEVLKGWVLPAASSDHIDINFIVDSANGNGLGLRSLKGSPLVSAVYMHTSATPAAGSPNPNSGYIYVQMAKQFYGYVSGYTGFVQPLSGTPIPVASPTPGILAGTAYVIAAPGTTPASQWYNMGLAPGLTPTAGQAFVGAVPSPLPTGSGIVETSAFPGVGHIEVVGDPNQTVAATAGATILCVCVTGSSVATPTDGTVIGMRFVYQ